MADTFKLLIDRASLNLWLHGVPPQTQYSLGLKVAFCSLTSSTLWPLLLPNFLAKLTDTKPPFLPVSEFLLLG